MLRVRAVREVSAVAELTLAYVNLMEPRAVRRQQLQESKHFLCICERCSEPLPDSTDRFLEVRSVQRRQLDGENEGSTLNPKKTIPYTLTQKLIVV